MRRTIRLTALAAATGMLLLGLSIATASRAATILVKPGKLDHFVLTAPPTALAGENFLVRIEPFDANDNLITEFRGKSAVFAVSISGGGEVVPPAPEVSPEDAARERERASAIKAREEAQRAQDEAEKKRAREAATKARAEAVLAAEKSQRKPAVPPPARPLVKILEKVTVEEGKDQVVVRLFTSGPVSYNASTGSRLSKEWIWIELFPMSVDTAVGRNVAVASTFVGEVTVEQIEPEKVRVALQVLPPGISYVVTQQDRSVVVKVVRTE